MSDNANSVNINVRDRSYHHGDLRGAVVAEGLRLLAVGTAERLSLREIARNVGVSATAIYRHFPDKDALLLALAEAGYARLAAAQKAVSQEGGAKGFAACGRAYVRFAIDNPALFRLIFVSTPIGMHPAAPAPAGSPARVLEHGIAEIMGAGATPEARFAAMLRAWSLVHGLAMLILDGQIDRDTGIAMIDHVVTADSLSL